MRTDTKTKRQPVPRSKPTYPIDLTNEEIHLVVETLRAKLTANEFPSERQDLIACSAIAALRWGRYGRS